MFPYISAQVRELWLDRIKQVSAALSSSNSASLPCTKSSYSASLFASHS